MRTTLRKSPSILVLIAVAAMVAGMLVPAASASADPSGDGIQWRSCHELFECGSLSVPLDYSDPGGPTISLAVIRLPAAAPDQRIGSLILDPGGPGVSGVDFVHGAGPFLFDPSVRTRFDLVGFDPRGIARSNPIQCFHSEEEANTALPPFAFPTTRAEEQVWIASDRKITAACDRHAGPIIDHMATADAARDIDRLRIAVGDPKLTYVGYSYGSYLGVTYANLFPDNVRALVVDGVLDPVAWATGSGAEGGDIPFSTRLHSEVGAQATLDEFFRLCDAGGPNCAFSPDSAARYAALAASLQGAPAAIAGAGGGDVEITYADLIAGTLGAMDDSSSWPDFAALLEALEGGSAQDRGARLSAFRADLGLDAAPSGAYHNEFESFTGVACADADNPDDPRAWHDAAAVGSTYFGPLWTWISSICAGWHGVDTARYTGPFTNETSTGLLVVGNQYDPRTRYEGAQKVAELMPGARLLTVHAWGHTSLFTSSCADRAIAKYLIAQIQPADGTVCEADTVPFAGADPGVAPGAAAARAVLLPAVVVRATSR